MESGRDVGRAVLRAPPSVEDNPYCPECGRLLNEPPPDRSGPPTSYRWWPVMLVALGTYLVVVFGLRAWHASTDLASNQARLRTLAEATVTAPPDKDAREWLAAVEASLAARRPFDPVAAAAERELTRSRVAVALGVAALVLGLGTLVRDGVVRARHPRWTRGDGRTPGPPRRPLGATMRGLGALSETTITALLLVFLMAFGVITVARLLHGAPLTWDLVDQALDQTLDDVVVLVGMLA